MVKSATLRMWESIKTKLIINLEISILNKIIENLSDSFF